MESENVNRDLVYYFIIAYIVSWLLWLPGVLFTNGLIGGSFEIYFLLGISASFGPMVSAFSLSLIFEGKEGLKTNLKRWLNYKFGWWRIPSIVLIPIIIIFAHLLNVVFFAGSFPATGIPIVAIPLIFISNLVIGGSLGEEFGWRGYAKPRIEEKINSLSANIILGILWRFWHLPLFFVIGFPHHDFLPLWLFVINSVMFSLIIAWIQNNSEQSVIPALIIHTWLNVLFVILPVIEPVPGGNYIPWLLGIIIMGIVIVLVTIFYGTDFIKSKKKSA